jgi:hypothetical protein
MNTRRAIETTILVLIGVLLAVATAHDLSRQVSVNHRLMADLSTWRAVTGHHYHNVSIEQNIEHRGTREVVCGNTSPGGPGARTQFCLILTGPVLAGRRAVRGGYYLPPYVEDLRRYRYACFGAAAREHLCGQGG